MSVRTGGISIRRLAPMEGVLAYERDRIVDVKEAARLAAQEAEAEAEADAQAATESPAEAAAEEVVAVNEVVGAGTAD